MIGPLIFVGLLLFVLGLTLRVAWREGHPKAERCPGRARRTAQARDELRGRRS